MPIWARCRQSETVGSTAAHEDCPLRPPLLAGKDLSSRCRVKHLKCGAGLNAFRYIARSNCNVYDSWEAQNSEPENRTFFTVSLYASQTRELPILSATRMPFF